MRCVICGGGRDEHGPIASRAHNFEAEVLGASMSDSMQKPSESLDVAEIVRRGRGDVMAFVHAELAATESALAEAKAEIERQRYESETWKAASTRNRDRELSAEARVYAQAERIAKLEAALQRAGAYLDGSFAESGEHVAAAIRAALASPSEPAGGRKE